MVPHPLCACFGFSSLVLVWFLSCFGRRYLRRGGVWVLSVCCAKKHSAVSGDDTRRQSGTSPFFLRSFSLTTVATLPGFAHTGREYHTALWRPTSCVTLCVIVRLHTVPGFTSSFTTPRLAQARAPAAVLPSATACSRMSYLATSDSACTSGSMPPGSGTSLP